jgi:hypothetical protein
LLQRPSDGWREQPERCRLREAGVIIAMLKI